MNLLGESNILVILGIFLTAGCFVLHLIGFATPYWFKNGPYHLGLWQVCGDIGICVTLTDAPLKSQFEAAQVIECLAFLAFLGALVIIILKLLVMKENNMLYIVMALAAWAAGGLSLLGVIIFGTINGYDASKFHFSMAFCIIAALGAGVAGLMIIVGRNKANL